MTTGLELHPRYKLPIWAVRAARIIVTQRTSRSEAVWAHDVQAIAQLIMDCNSERNMECGPWSGIPLEVSSE